MSRPSNLLATLFVVIVACGQSQLPAQTAAAPRTASGSQQPSAVQQLPDFAALVDRYSAAVVNVEVVGRAPVDESAQAQPADDALSDFLRRFGMPGPGSAPPRTPPAPLVRGSGSGFIVTPDGYILTNAHVVAGAERVTVRLTDRRELQAKLIGTDPRTDVAVIKIDARDLPTVHVGNHRELRTGEWVLAIGAPFGLESTATAGIVSATSRAVSSEVEVPFIQTDVAVNPGNSGGPLFNLRGEVVGINSMIFSQTGGYMGISFAVPIEVAMQVRDQLVKTGRVIRGYLGVSVQEVDAELARSFGLDRPRGALVNDVRPRSAAATAGLETGDIILSLNGKSIDESSALPMAVSRLPPGSSATLAVWRGGKQAEIRARVAEFPQPASPRPRPAPPDEQSGGLGLVVRPLSAQEKSRLGTDHGLLVAAVGGNAAVAGIEAGDIVLAINGTEVRSVETLREHAANLKKDQPAALLIARGNAQLFVPVRVNSSTSSRR